MKKLIVFVLILVFVLMAGCVNSYSEKWDPLRITNAELSSVEYNDLRIIYPDKPFEVSTITTGDISFNIENTGFYEENVTTYRVSAVAYDNDYPICSADSEGFKIVKPGEIKTMSIHCVSSRQPGEYIFRRVSRIDVKIVRKEDW